MVQAQRLLAGVALRGGVRLVAADAVERVAVLTEAHLDAAVALAQDAGRRLPVGVRHGRTVRHVRCITQRIDERRHDQSAGAVTGRKPGPALART